MESFRVPNHGAYLRYHDLPGGGPPLIFLHGLGSASSSYFPRGLRHPRLAGRRAILIDLLGFGFSDRPEDFSYAIEAHAGIVGGLLDHLCLKRSVIIGHSMGGSIGIVIAENGAERIDRLIVAEPNLDPGPGMVSGPISSQSEEEFVSGGYADFLAGIMTADLPDYAGTVQAADPLALHRSAVSLIAERRPTFREILLSLTVSNPLQRKG